MGRIWWFWRKQALLLRIWVESNPFQREWYSWGWYGRCESLKINRPQQIAKRTGRNSCWDWIHSAWDGRWPPNRAYKLAPHALNPKPWFASQWNFLGKSNIDAQWPDKNSAWVRVKSKFRCCYRACSIGKVVNVCSPLSGPLTHQENLFSSYSRLTSKI